MTHSQLDPNKLTNLKAVQEAIPRVSSLRDLNILNEAMPRAIAAAQQGFEDAKLQGDLESAKRIFEELQGATETLRQHREALRPEAIFLAEFQVDLKGLAILGNIELTFTIPKCTTPLEIIERANQLVAQSKKNHRPPPVSGSFHYKRKEDYRTVDKAFLAELADHDKTLTTAAQSDRRLRVESLLKCERVPASSLVTTGEAVLAWAVHRVAVVASSVPQDTPLDEGVFFVQCPTSDGYHIALGRDNRLRDLDLVNDTIRHTSTVRAFEV
jgi:hypothetical protein